MSVPMTDERIRWHLLQRLGELMSEMSEDCFAAGWMMGWQDDGPKRMRFIAGYTGWKPECDKELALAACELADYLGHWAKPGDDGNDYEPYTPKEQPDHG